MAIILQEKTHRFENRVACHGETPCLMCCFNGSKDGSSHSTDMLAGCGATTRQDRDLFTCPDNEYYVRIENEAKGKSKTQNPKK